jgi:hypothetical protein
VERLDIRRLSVGNLLEAKAKEETSRRESRRAVPTLWTTLSLNHQLMQEDWTYALSLHPLLHQGLRG